MANNQAEKVDSRKMYEDQRLLDLMEQRSIEQDRKFRDIYKKSRILQHDNENKDDIIASNTELEGLLERIRKVENEKIKAKTYTLSDPEYYQYLIRNNLDLVSNLTLEVSCILMCYPFNTIKTRIQAKHPLEDISFFVKNNVQNFPLYRGIGQGMLSTFSGVCVNNAAYRWANLELMKNQYLKGISTFQKQLLCFTFADIFATPFRLPFEVRKMYLQMNSGEIGFNRYMNGMKSALLPSLMRDFFYRVGFNSVFQLCLHGENYVNLYTSSDPYQRQLIQHHIDRSIPNQGDYNRRITGMILGSLVGIILSNPFDLITTRLVTQQYPKYEGFTNCLKTIIREEKVPKLFLSGFGPRSAYYMISGSVIFNFYDTFRQMIGEAYAY